MVKWCTRGYRASQRPSRERERQGFPSDGPGICRWQALDRSYRVDRQDVRTFSLASSTICVCRKWRCSMCLCTRDQTTRTACAPGTTAVVEHMLDPLAGHRRIRQGAAPRHAETRRRLIYRGRDTGRRHRVCGQCRGYRIGSGSMVAPTTPLASSLPIKGADPFLVVRQAKTTSEPVLPR